MRARIVKGGVLFRLQEPKEVGDVIEGKPNDVQPLIDMGNAEPIYSRDELEAKTVDELEQLAKRAGLYEDIEGSGKGGRVVRNDLVAALVE